MVKKNYGATEQEWLLLDVTLELTEDLLPVVSNPEAPISPNSKMKEKGKTPSQYNRNRQVGGFPEWTQYKATPKDITKWSKEPDYGICLQTRYVRALDFDIKTNRATVTDFVDAYTKKHFGFLLPLRNRVDSSKSLMMYRLKGEYPKRVVKVNSGMVENLKNGQQLILCGTHPEGQRYQLDMRGNKDIPEIDEEQDNALWKAICDNFGIEKASEGHVRKKGESFAAEDEIAPHLDIKGGGKDGQLYIDCPWKSEHSMDGGEAETAYFPPGTGGYVLPHFKCYHAHCSHRTDSDFLDALNITDKIIKFESIPVTEQVDVDGSIALCDLPSLDRDKAGKALIHEPNLRLVFSHPESFGYLIKLDDFNGTVMIGRCDGAGKPKNGLRRLEDEDYFSLKLKLGKLNFKLPIRTELIREAVNHTARRSRFDSAIDWLNGIKEWDGVERIEHFLPTYFGSENTPYARAIGKYWWSAQAGRILRPGAKADMMPILEGTQGFKKSWALKAMLPSEDFYGNISLSDNDEKNVRLMSGKLLCEADETKGLNSGRELESIKSFITKTTDEHIPKYREKSKLSPRRCVIVGTTNKKEILTDDTGNRRFLPIEVTKADRDAIARDMEMLWAEAKIFYKEHGIYWQAEKYSAEAHDKYKQREIWEEDISEWLHTAEEVDGLRPIDKEYITTKEVLDNAVRVETSKKDPRTAARVAKALGDLGYEQKISRIDGRSKRVWVKKQKESFDDLI